MTVNLDDAQWTFRDGPAALRINADGSVSLLSGMWKHHVHRFEVVPANGSPGAFALMSKADIFRALERLSAADWWVISENGAGIHICHQEHIDQRSYQLIAAYTRGTPFPLGYFAAPLAGLLERYREWAAVAPQVDAQGLVTLWDPSALAHRHDLASLPIAALARVERDHLPALVGALNAHGWRRDGDRIVHPMGASPSPWVH